YFASDGHQGFGGMDIYKTRSKGKRRWTPPENIGYPLNSPQDDFGIIFDKFSKTGFLTSNRNNPNGKDNIFEFTIQRPDFECMEVEKNNYCFRFFEEGDFIPDPEMEELGDTVQWIYDWNLGDGTRKFGEEVRHCFEGPGSYLVEMNMYDSVTNYYILGQAIYQHDVEDIDQVYIDGADTVRLGASVNLDGARSGLPGHEIAEYFWDWGDGELSAGEKAKHTYFEAGEYTVTLGLLGEATKAEPTGVRACAKRQVVVLAEADFDSVMEVQTKAQKARDNVRSQEKAAEDAKTKRMDALFKRIIAARDSLDKLEALQRERLQKRQEEIERRKNRQKEIEQEEGSDNPTGRIDEYMEYIRFGSYLHREDATAWIMISTD
ncbi:MAG: PKD domain-containing protein, partial [Bacteroidota bacterium]